MDKFNNEEYPQAKEELMPSFSLKAMILGIVVGIIVGVAGVVGVVMTLRSLL